MVAPGGDSVGHPASVTHDGAGAQSADPYHPAWGQGTDSTRADYARAQSEPSRPPATLRGRPEGPGGGGAVRPGAPGPALQELTPYIPCVRPLPGECPTYPRARVQS